jgi:predicted RNA-binding Zn-ribbon protein involved in translation (DUF1610 family)
MKKLTKDEFFDRAMAIQRARKIFIESGLTNNISIAFDAYQSIFAERERQIFMDSVVLGKRAETPMDKYERPKCPECGTDMMFRKVDADGIATQLVCGNPKCDTVLDSEYTLEQWMKMLEKKDEHI